MNLSGPFTTCPVCATPTTGPEGSSSRPYYCSIVCYRLGHGLDHPEPPSRHDAVTMTCPIDHQPFTPIGRQSCSPRSDLFNALGAAGGRCERLERVWFS